MGEAGSAAVVVAAGEGGLDCTGVLFDDFEDREAGEDVWELGNPGDRFFLGSTPGGPDWDVTNVLVVEAEHQIVIRLVGEGG